jgi:dienelactone hydrolase
MMMLKTTTIEYTEAGIVFQAFVAFEKSHTDPKPCVMIAHDWSGRTDSFCEKAKQYAARGYVGFALDMYGDAKTGSTIAEKQALLSPIMENRAVVTERMIRAFDSAAGLPEVDNNKIAAIGYCFGGLCVLDLARAGADIKGVVSIHGLLTSPEQVQCEHIRSKILALHGYDDPMVPPQQVQQFASEMTLKKADWQVHMYGRTQHAFTNPEAHDVKLGLVYNDLACRRSTQSADAFLEEIFSPQG